MSPGDDERRLGQGGVTSSKVERQQDHDHGATRDDRALRDWPDDEAAAAAGRCTGADGKTYAMRPLTGPELEFLRGRAHYLWHAEGQSVRQIVGRLQVENNVRRSVGAVHGWLTTWQCDHCSGGEDGSPEHPTGAVAEPCSGVPSETPERQVGTPAEVAQ